MTPSNLDLARECGANERIVAEKWVVVEFYMEELDAFAARIRAALAAAPPAPQHSKNASLPVIAYLRATSQGEPIWMEDCVCQDAVFPSDPDGSDADDVSMPMVRLADAQAAIDAFAERIRAEVQPYGISVRLEPSPPDHCAVMLMALDALDVGLWELTKHTGWLGQAEHEQMRQACIALSQTLDGQPSPAAVEPVGYVYSDSTSPLQTKNAAINRDIPNGTPLYIAAQQPLPRCLSGFSARGSKEAEMNDEAKKAFDAWCVSDNPRYHPADDSMLNRRDWKVWQAATLAERERCAVLVEQNAKRCSGMMMALLQSQADAISTGGEP